MKTILFMSLIFSYAYGAEFTTQIWSQANDHYLFSLHGATQTLISENCFNAEVTLQKSKCDAAKALLESKTLTIPPLAFRGGKNPGAVACTVGLKKKIRILKDPKNNENSFCVFEDGSMVSAINLKKILKD